MPTPFVFMKHANSQLKKFLGIEHKDVDFDKSYTYIKLPGKVVYNEDDLFIVQPDPQTTLAVRALVELNPEIHKFGIATNPSILEPGEIPTAYLHSEITSFSEMNLEWVFRVYFIR